MEKNMRRSHDSAFKAKVALEALKGGKTLPRLPSEFKGPNAPRFLFPISVRCWA
jgi:hypothetical protein